MIQRRTRKAVRNGQEVYRRLARAGMVFSAFACALLAHVLLGWAQNLRLLHGDYASHPHDSLGPLTFAILFTGAGAGLLFLLHVADSGSHSLPSLARAWRQNLDLRAAVAIVAFACAMLIGMETVEQLVAHRFDGILSAFTDNPAVALALVVAITSAIVAAQRLLCAWLGRVDGRVFFALLTILRDRTHIDVALFKRFSPNRSSGFRTSREVSHIFSKRAPPIRLAQ